MDLWRRAARISGMEEIRNFDIIIMEGKETILATIKRQKTTGTNVRE